MPLSTYDFEVGVDFTGQASISGATLNAGVNLATPKYDSTTEGKGLVIVTIDTAPGVPTVPNAVANTKWKRYLWVRIPHSTITDKTPYIYGWNDSATSVATYLKWIQITVDVVAINAAIATAQLTADNAATDARYANNTASALRDLVNQAVTDASTAVSVANGISATANQALTEAAEATAVVDALSSQVTDLSIAVASAEAAVTASRSTSSLSAAAGNNGKYLQVDFATDAVILREKLKDISIYHETRAVGSDWPLTLAKGANLRELNVEHTDTDACFTVNPATFKLTVDKSGTYYVKAYLPFWADIQGDYQMHIPVLKNEGTAAILITGNVSDHYYGMPGVLEGVVALTAGTVLGLYSYTNKSCAGGDTSTFGYNKAADGIPAGITRIFASITFMRLA